ncbi:MAG: Eco57I restriction-modification methylase domain-containing protein [Elusimicrobia bacterium]|nr:Eco57I restriction-modification methylase domain-containing protein [Elusimicrobiota bacterium]
MNTVLKKPELSNHSLIGYAEHQTNTYYNNQNIAYRKQKAQFFTPSQIAFFMADMFDIKKQSFSILDPGAGTGMLSAAFCEKLLSYDRTFTITLDAYETDSELKPYLKTTLEKCKQTFEEKGSKFCFNIIEKDFILNNADYLNNSLFTKNQNYYDIIISNPPYFKLNKNSPQSKIMEDILSGQPNIYAFFMAVSLKMLSSDGQMVFITPRSFCSGLYFKRFRAWLLKNSKIDRIHLFESRDEIFEEVLQENIIVKFIQKTSYNKNQPVIITNCKNGQLNNVNKLKVEYKDMLHDKTNDVFIKIPTSHTEIKVQHIINNWKYSINSFGFKVSTGPVVSFRAKNHLSPKFRNNKTTAPLLWMHNIKGMDVIWPIKKNGKELAINVSEETQPLLLSVNNFVLVKRFSSKEQNRRLYAGVFLKSNFDNPKIGIENHLNYIYKYKGTLSIDEAYGIAALLNTSIVDIFFRMLNGNTQVNAVDINNIPLPYIEGITKIGKKVQKMKPAIGIELDKIVVNILDIDDSILYEIKEIYAKNGKN